MTARPVPDVRPFRVPFPTATAAGAAPERYTSSADFEDTIDCSTFNPAWNFNDDFHDFSRAAARFGWTPQEATIRAIEARPPPLERRQQRRRLHAARAQPLRRGIRLRPRDRDAERRNQHHAAPVDSHTCVNLMGRRRQGRAVSGPGHACARPGRDRRRGPAALPFEQARRANMRPPARN